MSLCLEIYRLELMSVSGHKSIVTFYFYFSPGKLGSVWMNLWKCGPNMQMARLVFISVVWHAWRGRPAGKFFGRVSRSISTHDQPESLWNLMTGPLFCFFFKKLFKRSIAWAWSPLMNSSRYANQSVNSVLPSSTQNWWIHQVSDRDICIFFGRFWIYKFDLNENEWNVHLSGQLEGAVETERLRSGQGSSRDASDQTVAVIGRYTRPWQHLRRQFLFKKFLFRFELKFWLN